MSLGVCTSWQVFHRTNGRSMILYKESCSRYSRLQGISNSMACVDSWIVPQCCCQKENAISQHTLDCTMEIIFLFFYCNPFPARGVPAGNICINKYHPSGCLQNLCFVSSLMSFCYRNFFLFPTNWLEIFREGEEGAESRAKLCIGGISCQMKKYAFWNCRKTWYLLTNTLWLNTWITSATVLAVTQMETKTSKEKDFLKKNYKGKKKSSQPPQALQKEAWMQSMLLCNLLCHTNQIMLISMLETCTCSFIFISCKYFEETLAREELLCGKVRKFRKWTSQSPEHACRNHGLMSSIWDIFISSVTYTLLALIFTFRPSCPNLM